DGVLLDGDAAAVVADAEAAVVLNAHVDVLAVAGQRLVHAVGQQFVNEVVQPLGAGAADVQVGPAADVGGVAQDADVLLGVVAVAAGQGVGYYNAFIVHGCRPRSRRGTCGGSSSWV